MAIFFLLSTGIPKPYTETKFVSISLSYLNLTKCVDTCQMCTLKAAFWILIFRYDIFNGKYLQSFDMPAFTVLPLFKVILNS